MSGAYLSILIGESYSFETNVTLDGNNVDLDGALLWFLAQQSEMDGLQNNVIFNVSTDTGQVAISGNNNSIVTVNLNANVTANFLQSNVARWALRGQMSNGQVVTFDRGQLAVEHPVGSP